MIAVKNLTKEFKNTEVVKSLDFDLKAGDVLALVGPNGAGKTTVLRCLCGILQFENGKVEINSFDISKQDLEAKKELAFLPDYPSFFDSLTSMEHIDLVAALYGIKNYSERAEMLLKRFHLFEKRNDFPSQFSRGMRQSLGIICALIHDPKVILMDEPTTGLDPNAVRAFTECVEEERAKGKCLIISSHSLAVLESVSTKVLLLHKGKREVYGNIADIKKQSADKISSGSLEELFFHFINR